MRILDRVHHRKDWVHTAWNLPRGSRPGLVSFPYINGRSAERPVRPTLLVLFTTGDGTGVATVLVLLKLRLGCVDVPSPESKGSSRSAEGGSAGAMVVVGATRAVGTTGAIGLKGSTVTWITDRAGLKRMVTVALACRIIGTGRASAGNSVRGAAPNEKNGPEGRRGGNTPQNGIGYTKGYGYPCRKEN
ncbi:MAG: hypothetical protein ACMUIS_05130 [bacterium]